MKQLLLQNNMKRIVLFAVTLGAILALALSAAPEVSAQVDSVREGIGATTTEDVDDADADVTGLVQQVINIFSWVVGIISVIMIIIGGLKYIMSTGDSQKVDSAKNTILYAIIGLVIVAFAQIIVLFTIDTVDSDDDDDDTSHSSLIAEL